MTVTQTPAVPFGRQLGVAARRARALLDDVLKREAMTYETWIALNLLAAPGPQSTREPFARALADALSLSDVAVAQLLGQLEGFGLIRTVSEAGQESPHLALSEDGAGHLRRVLAEVNQASGQALSGVSPGDVLTTTRVLQQFTERIDERLAG